MSSRDDIDNAVLALPGNQTGFTMIELLVSVLVMSIGILATAMLQLKGMQYATESAFRTQAAYVAQEVVDRVRSDASADTSPYEDLECYRASGAVVCNRAGTAISNSSTALNDVDILDWGDRISSSHPLGRVRVCHGDVSNNDAGSFNCDGTGDVWTVTVMWDEGRRGATGVDCTTDTTTDLQCYQVDFVKL